MLSLQEISDRLEIQDLAWRYSEIIDTKDFDKLRDDVLAAVREMGARTEAEPRQEDRPSIHPGVSAVKMERDGTRVVYATPPSGGRQERFLATNIEDAKTFAGQNVRTRRRAENREVAKEIKTKKITKAQAATGMRAPSPRLACSRCSATTA